VSEPICLSFDVPGVEALKSNLTSRASFFPVIKAVLVFIFLS
jgi:hypothetical protein